MSQDITAALLGAAANASSWDGRRFEDLLAAIRKADPSAMVDWDDGVPENWARVNPGSVAPILIHAEVPIAIAVGDWPGAIGTCVAAAGLVAVSVGTWDLRELSMDLDAVARVIPDWAWRFSGGPEEIDPSGFSLWDLWWSTVI
jgi:hypothetical protein